MKHTAPLPFITPYCWGYWWVREDGFTCAWLGGHTDTSVRWWMTGRIGIAGEADSMMRFSTQVHSEPVESILDTGGIILKGEELRGFVPDKLLERRPPVPPDTGTVIGTFEVDQ